MGGKDYKEWYRLFRWLLNEGHLKGVKLPPKKGYLFKKYFSLFPHFKHFRALQGQSFNELTIIKNEIEYNEESPIHKSKYVDVVKSKTKKRLREKQEGRLHPKKKLTILFEGAKDHKEKYTRYINSPLWRKFKIKIRKKRGNKCEICGKQHSKTEPLHGHHLHYKNLFNEKEEDIQILCKNCHDKQHE
jgi:hypothetical protein